jgi:hypothetical protein
MPECPARKQTAAAFNSAPQGYVLLARSKLDVLRLIFDGNGNKRICLNEHAIKFSRKKYRGMLGTNDGTHSVITAINE